MILSFCFLLASAQQVPINLSLPLIGGPGSNVTMGPLPTGKESGLFTATLATTGSDVSPDLRLNVQYFGEWHVMMLSRSFCPIQTFVVGFLKFAYYA